MRSDEKKKQFFLKKRTKKLLFSEVVPAGNDQTIKSFLFLFFKKEILPFFLMRTP